MKALICLSLLVACSYGALLGANKCTYGPSYWCDNIKNAKECSAVSHCTDAWKTKVVDESDSEICTFCEDMVKDIKAYIDGNATKGAIEAYMKRGCAYFPDTFSQTECMKVAQHYFEEFYNMVEQGVSPKAVCQLATLCTNGTSKMKVSLVGNSQCDACEALMTQLKKEIDDPKNQAALIKMGQAECEKLGSLAGACKQMVAEYMPELVSFADGNLGTTVCALLGVCTSATETPVIDFKSLAIAAMKQAKIPERIQKLSRKLNAGDEKYCDTCEEVFGYLKIIMNNNATEQEAKQLLENDLCPQLGQLQDLCKGVVEQYLPKVWGQIIFALDPATVCTELGLCNSTSSAIKQNPVQQVKTDPKATASIQCVLCEFVVSKLDGMITTNATEEEIIKAVEKVCSILPSSIRNDCDTLVEQYGAEIIKLIVSGAGPETICTFIGLCSSTQSAVKIGSENCVVCELAMGYLKKILANSQTDEQIIHQLETICTKLSPDLTQECKSMMDKYGPNILEMIASKIEAKAWCADLGLCPASTFKADGLVHLYNRKFVN